MMKGMKRRRLRVSYKFIAGDTTRSRNCGQRANSFASRTGPRLRAAQWQIGTVDNVYSNDMTASLPEELL